MLFRDWLHPLRWNPFGGARRLSGARRDHKRKPLWSSIPAQVEVFESRDLPSAGPVASTMADLGRLDLITFPTSQAQLPDWGTAFQLQHGQIDNMTEFAPADIGNYSDTINQSDSWSNSYSDEYGGSYTIVTSTTSMWSVTAASSTSGKWSYAESLVSSYSFTASYALGLLTASRAQWGSFGYTAAADYDPTTSVAKYHVNSLLNEDHWTQSRSDSWSYSDPMSGWSGSGTESWSTAGDSGYSYQFHGHAETKVSANRHFDGKWSGNGSGGTTLGTWSSSGSGSSDVTTIDFMGTTNVKANGNSNTSGT